MVKWFFILLFETMEAVSSMCILLLVVPVFSEISQGKKMLLIKGDDDSIISVYG